jgi:hypothetical protein
MADNTIFIQRPTESERQKLIDRTAGLLKSATREQLIKALSDMALNLVHRTVNTENEELAYQLALHFICEALEGES